MSTVFTAIKKKDDYYAAYEILNANPVCPYSGGVGLCKYVQHLSMIRYIAIMGIIKNRLITMPGYSIEMKSQTLQDYSSPEGKIWRN
jgi:L-fuconate dehydratase